MKSEGIGNYAKSKHLILIRIILLNMNGNCESHMQSVGKFNRQIQWMGGHIEFSIEINAVFNFITIKQVIKILRPIWCLCQIDNAEMAFVVVPKTQLMLHYDDGFCWLLLLICEKHQSRMLCGAFIRKWWWVVHFL